MNNRMTNLVLSRLSFKEIANVAEFSKVMALVNTVASPSTRKGKGFKQFFNC